MAKVIRGHTRHGLRLSCWQNARPSSISFNSSVTNRAPRAPAAGAEVRDPTSHHQLVHLLASDIVQADAAVLQHCTSALSLMMVHAQYRQDGMTVRPIGAQTPGTAQPAAHLRAEPRCEHQHWHERDLAEYGQHNRVAQHEELIAEAQRAVGACMQQPPSKHPIPPCVSRVQNTLFNISQFCRDTGGLQCSQVGEQTPTLQDIRDAKQVTCVQQ